MSELFALIILAVQPAFLSLDGIDTRPAFATAGMLSQYVQYSPKCVTPSAICYIDPPQPVGDQCQCPTGGWGTIQP